LGIISQGAQIRVFCVSGILQAWHSCAPAAGL